MKTIFLTSNLCCYKKEKIGDEEIKRVTKCDNSNHFIDRLKIESPKIKKFVFVASDPDSYRKIDEYSGSRTGE